MHSITREAVKELASFNSGPCVSLYAPMEPPGGDTGQNPKRLKNLLKASRDALTRLGVRLPEKYLAAASDLMDDHLFWQRQQRGLALFVAGEYFRMFRVPLSVPELSLVSTRFHVKPLVPLIVGDGTFFILALSRKELTLYRATRFSIEEIALENVPESEAEALRFDEPTDSLQMHTVEPGVASSMAGGIFHGHGAAKEDHKERAHRYFTHIDRALQPYLRNERAPMILAGVEYYLPIYQAANTYAHLVDDVIPGNPGLVTADALRQAGWKKVEHTFQKSRQAAFAQTEAGLARDHATADPEEAAVAASHGRVEYCFFKMAEQQWAFISPDGGGIRLAQGPEEGARDLIDVAAVETLLHGGSVFPSCDGEPVPGNGAVAAILRF